ncbi:uncharacterized protein BDW47DRAFT_109792 [Aspergillus candidus]|uniref:Uncharacterized protein n=1 Tax=Aspergillus candidus TaxID=41067 RepID=A0A2I2F5C1_ASPCN|nr:hypothetical protein BDW47DRAFT_109792 [Aspergillus candidus]PLB35778.1 hypothetical protein BDW47DRAFT_109792 [Aspergillus candidus]
MDGSVAQHHAKKNVYDMYDEHYANHTSTLTSTILCVPILTMAVLIASGDLVFGGMVSSTVISWRFLM